MGKMMHSRHTGGAILCLVICSILAVSQGQWEAGHAIGLAVWGVLAVSSALAVYAQLFSTLVFWIAARLYVFPKLASLPTRAVLQPILLLHALRHLGLMFLAAGGMVGYFKKRGWW